MIRKSIIISTALACVASCKGDGKTSQLGQAEALGINVTSATPVPPDFVAKSANGMLAVNMYQRGKVFRPYAIAPLSLGYALIVSYRDGLQVLSPNGTVSRVTSPVSLYVPFDILTAPDFGTTGRIFIAFAEQGADREGGADDGRGNGANLAIMSANITIDTLGNGKLTNVNTIWRQIPRVTNLGEFGGRLRFSVDGRYLFVTTGDRQLFQPAQALENTVGKVLRLNPDGTIPADNPYVNVKGALPEIWTVGHRNPYGLDFDAQGRLWSHEHGPAGGDEFNLIERGANCGWPSVSYGNHYDGGAIPKPADGDGFHQSAIVWTPAIAPAGMTIYNGALFRSVANHAVIGGLKSQALIIVSINAEGTAKEVDRMPMGFRVRDVRSAADGSIWVVEDAEFGRVFRLTPQS